MAVRKIKNSWWIDFTFGQTRYRKRSPENSRAAALAYEATLRQKLVRGEVVDQVVHETKDVTFGQFAWQWFEQYVVANNKFSEQRAKKSILSLVLIPSFGKLPISKIDTYHIEQFKAQQRKNGVSQKTLKNRLTVLSKCLSCAHDWLKLNTAPPKVKWPKCPPPTTDYLSAQECELLLSEADGVIHEMILTALRTGMRQGELKGLQWSSINWENRSVVIRHSYCDVRQTLDTPKSNRERHIPLDVDVYELLYRRKKSTGYVFMDVDNDKPFNSPRVNLRLAKVCERAGLRIITWHVLRHTFASHLAMKGTPLHIVQMLLGHSSITTTMRYAHVAPSTMRAAIDLLNPKTAVCADFGQPVGNQWMLEQSRAVHASLGQH
jgi:integrase